MITSKKFISLLCILTLLCSLAVPTSAANISSTGGNASSQITFSTTADGTLDGTLSSGTTLSVTVPTTLPMAIGPDGTVTTSDSAAIVNHSYGAVRVSNVEIKSGAGWKMVEYGDLADFASKKVNTKEFAFSLQLGDGETYYTDGSSETQITFISSPEDGCYMSGCSDTSNNSIALTYGAILPAFSSQQNAVNLAQVVFTVEWDT